MDDLSEVFSLEDQVSIYRIFQQAMDNISRYAQASQVTLSAKKTDDRVDFLVEDNGQGFEVGRIEDVEAGRKGIGLAAISERVRALGGTFKHRKPDRRRDQGFLQHPQEPEVRKQWSVKAQS